MGLVLRAGAGGEGGTGERGRDSLCEAAGCWGARMAHVKGCETSDGQWFVLGGHRRGMER